MKPGMLGTPLLECIPNVSEGQDKLIIDYIAKEVESIPGVKLMHVDTGYSANRTVYTFAGEPVAVADAAFQLVKVGTELIDMRKHMGTHPRIGVVDVCPLVPLSGFTMEETVKLARDLAKRIGEELHLPVYCYEKAAFVPERENLAKLRAGGYEKLKDKLKDPLWKPDFGPWEFNSRSGMTVIGARNILVAYNINLKSPDVSIAKKIATAIRESSNLPSSIKHLKAIGWYVPEYKKVQVSTNIIDYKKTPIHLVYETIKQLALEYGIEVTGSELIGMAPMEVLTEAGKYYLQKRGKTSSNPDHLIQIAVEEMGLGDLSKFIPNKRIIENFF